MDYAQATEYVVDQLGRRVSRDDIIFSLCQMTGESWPQASAFVEQIEKEKHSKIAMGQLPLLMILGGGTIAVGAVITLLCLYFFAPLFTSRPLDVVALSRSYRMVIWLLTGVAMIAGGTYGTFRAIWQIWRR